MTAEERKHWDYIVKCNGDVPAIIAADAELTALRARVAQLDAVVEWACDELLRDENADPPSQYDTYAETAGDEAESFAVWLEAELYHRAGKEG